MSKDELRQRVEDIFRDVVDAPGVVFDEQLAAGELAQWDSLAHINLVSSLEKQFRIRFSLSEIDQMKTVGSILRLLEKKLAPKDHVI